MAYAIVHKFKGGTREQYEASVGAVHPKGGKLPEGQIFHSAGPAVDGYWTVIAVHENRASWEKFRDTILKPALEKGVPGGFTTMPEETAFEVYNMQMIPLLQKLAKAA